MNIYILMERDKLHTRMIDNCVVGPYIYTTLESANGAAIRRSADTGVLITLGYTESQLVLSETVRAWTHSQMTSDLISIDDEIIPLTKKGARSSLSTDDWVHVFLLNQEILDQIANAISKALGLGKVEIRVANARDLQRHEARVERRVQFEVTPHTEFYETPGGFIGGDPLFEVRTSGMERLDRPELILRGVSGLMIQAAVSCLKKWAAHSLEYPITDGGIITDNHPEEVWEAPTVVLKAKKTEKGMLLVTETVQIPASKFTSKQCFRH